VEGKQDFCGGRSQEDNSHVNDNELRRVCAYPPRWPRRVSLRPADPVAVPSSLLSAPCAQCKAAALQLLPLEVLGVFVARVRHAQPHRSATDRGTVVSDTHFKVTRGNGGETEFAETRVLWEVTAISLKISYVSENLPSLFRTI